MADLPATQANTMLTAAFVPSTTYYLSLHTSNPGGGGASEVTNSGGSAYGRQAITFANPSAGSQASNNAQTFSNMPAESGGTPYYGLWIVLTGGTYLGGGTTTGLSGAISLGSSVVFNSGAVNQTVT
jgi:hypothetical protein